DECCSQFPRTSLIIAASLCGYLRHSAESLSHTALLGNPAVMCGVALTTARSVRSIPRTPRSNHDAPSNSIEWAQCVRVQSVRWHFYAADSGGQTVLRVFATVFAGLSSSQAARIVG